MVMPLYDHSPFRWPTPPYVMWSLIAINVIVFVAQSTLGPEGLAEVEHAAGLIPVALTSGQWGTGPIPPPLTLITALFVHANGMHIFGNMIFLFVFGDDIEEALGHWRFLFFYLACGLGADAAFVLSDPTSNIDLIGASGAVAGVISAYLLYRPCAKVTALLGLIPLRLRAYWLIGLWVILQIGEIASNAQDGVAYWAHIGGLITGAVLFVLMRPPGIPLLDCVHSEPFPAVGPAAPPR
jgi:membrane associated rhomboid family serine protease